jgi:DNA-binding transcriptional ArsR family regulator
MEEKQALSAFAALAHETRLAVFRLLVRQGPAGMPAGDVAQRLGIPPATLSFHLKELERAGLIQATRRHRQILYATDYAGTRELLDFLMRDCCQGHPEICGTAGLSPCAVPECAEAVDA